MKKSPFMILRGANITTFQVITITLYGYYKMGIVFLYLKYIKMQVEKSKPIISNFYGLICDNYKFKESSFLFCFNKF